MFAQIVRLPESANPFRESDFGRKLVWVVFLVTCLHMTFLQPYVIVLPNVRANIFSSLFAVVTLIAALVFLRKEWAGLRSYEIWIPLVLVLIAGVSSYYSNTSYLSSIRAFVIMSCMVAGYWSARVLLNTDAGRRFFTWFCLGLLLVTLVKVLAGVVIAGQIHRFADPHWHQTGARLLSLSFAPLALLSYGSRRATWLGVLFLGLTFLALLGGGKYNGMESVVIIPVILSFMALLLLKWTPRRLAAMGAMVLVSAVAVGCHFWGDTWPINKVNPSLAYRVENMFFSLHLAMKRPWYGIGLWAPREDYASDYQVKYPYTNRERFVKMREELRTSENTVLTFLADLGFPFVVLYVGSMLLIVWRLIRLTLHPPDGDYPHPLALLLPIVGASLHFQVTEGLFQPQVSWFFHILAGMAMCGPREKQADASGS